MSIEKTFAMLKPDSYQNKNIGGIIDMIEGAGFEIVAMKMVKVTKYLAGKFYAVHEERPFYGELCEYLASDKVVALVLQKENAVADYRTLAGATNPQDADKGTIRATFAKAIEANAVHGSDSKENAENEMRFFFSEMEIFGN